MYVTILANHISMLKISIWVILIRFRFSDGPRPEKIYIFRDTGFVLSTGIFPALPMRPFPITCTSLEIVSQDPLAISCKFIATSLVSASYPYLLPLI